MINKIVKIIEKEDERLTDLTKISLWHMDLEDFFRFILKYFELEKVLKDKFDEEFQYPNDYLYYRQEHKFLSYIEYLLIQIKPFLLLAYKLNELKDVSEIFKENNINEDSIVNMLDNFITLHRTGRPRKFYPLDSEDFQKFKEKYENIIEYLKEVKSGKVKSMRDFAIAVKNHNLSKNQLNKYRFEFNYWKEKCKNSSNSTIYRFDKDLIFLRKYYFYVKDALSKFDFYQNILKSDSLSIYKDKLLRIE